MDEKVLEKLKVLAESAKYDVSCASSGTSRKNKSGGIGRSRCHNGEKVKKMIERQKEKYETAVVLT